MIEKKWTGPQRQAIEARGGVLLISAAAGSGKTAVLVERVVSLLTDQPHPVDADRLLIVTFSNAAAAEMKQRIGARLSQLERASPGDLQLQRQLALLHSAQISTVHAFCLNLIRENFQKLDISPDFSIADEQELDILRADCLREAVEEMYETGSEEFYDLVELFSSGRDDRRLGETVLKLYDFARAHPFYEEWMEDKLALYDPLIPVQESVWGKCILSYAQAALSFGQNLLEEALERISGDPDMEKAYLDRFREDYNALGRILEPVKGKNWDGAVQAVRSMEFGRLGALRGYEDEQAKEAVQSARNRVKKMVAQLREKHLSATAGEFSEDIADQRPKIRMLFSLTRLFAEKLERRKTEKKRLDFTDLEHLALRLLLLDKETPAPEASEITGRFDYVLVDEYQDTNEVQDLLFQSISGENALFMVGDVKQSIYRFRQAMPEIFLSKKERFVPYDGSHYPARINLDTNFRSRSQVTRGVNFLFAMLMSRDLGEMDYTDEESLKSGAFYPDTSGMEPELLLLDTSCYSGAESSIALEARAIADRIVKMMEGGFQVAEDGQSRPLRLGDICILLRSPKNRSEQIVKELAAAGIPSWAESAGGFLASTEVSAVFSLLKLIDNPLLDVELAAAFLSPMFGFTEDDLTRIRLTGRKGPLYFALCGAAENGDAAAGEFLRVLRDLRNSAASLSAGGLIRRIYDLTDFPAVVSAMEMGKRRRDNLRLLEQYAADYHNRGYKGLGGFVRFISQLAERGGDLAPASLASEGADMVRILSIHRSKGLEFPVVFLADTARQFNREDLRSASLLHSEMGFATMRREGTPVRQYATIPLEALRLELERSMLSEEMRILYVALTRAKEKLILVGTLPRLSDKLDTLRLSLDSGRLPPYQVREAKSYCDWILAALLHHPGGHPLRNLCAKDALELLDDGNPWDIAIQTPLEAGEALPPKRVPLPADLELLLDIEKRFAYVYPFSGAVAAPTKMAVSAIAKEDGAAYRFSRRPRFISSRGLTGAEKGNALHHFMQFSDYNKARDDLEEEIRRMVGNGFLTPLEGQSLNRSRLDTFFRSSLADRIFGAQAVYREMKFLAEIGGDILGEYLPGFTGEYKTTVQGIADCVFIEGGKGFIVDYKTDFVKDASQLIGRYAVQMELYKKILAQNLELPIESCYIYSFSLNRQIELP